MHIPDLVQKQRDYFHKDETRSYSFRKSQLQKLKSVIKQNETNISKSLKTDLNKSEFESYTTEIGFLYAEINLVLKELKKWMKPTKVKTPTSHLGSKSYIYKEPYGVSLIISPWNYPFQLALAPVIGAIAGGNTVILKPSELTPSTSKLLKKIISETFEDRYFSVVEGAVEESQELLEQQVDLIFFTGSVPVGKVVMEKASQYLTPLILELGGKSPVIVDQSANLDLAAKRIVWGKFTNAGQTCIAPDYLYVHHNVKSDLLAKMRQYIKDIYGNHPLENKEYTHIVNHKHFNRLSSYLKEGEVIIGGSTDKEQYIIEPTILDGISWDDAVMEDEIFGPILPVLPYEKLDEIMTQIKSQPKPLAFYYFTENKRNQEYVLNHVPFGGGCINDTLFHVANPHLPFGGVGHSGIGKYHGAASYDAFTHSKSIVKQTTKFDMSFRYPDSKNGLSIIKRLLK